MASLSNESLKNSIKNSNLSKADQDQLNKLLEQIERNSGSGTIYGDKEELGYFATDNNGVPQFNKELAELQQQYRELAEKYTNNIKKLKDKFTDEIDKLATEKEKIEKEIDDLKADDSNYRYGNKKNGFKKSVQKEFEEKSEKSKKLNAQIEEKSIEYEKKRQEILSDTLIAQYKANKLNKELIEEQEYQNKLANKSLTIEEKRNHALKKRLGEERYERYQAGKQEFQNGINKIKSGFSGLKNAVQELVEPWKNVDQAVADYSKKVGLVGSQYERLRESTTELIHGNTKLYGELTGERDTTLWRLGLTTNDLLETQGETENEYGRRTGVNRGQAEAIGAMRKIVGSQDTAQYITSLEKFGLDQVSAMKRLEQIYKSANKSGLSFTKYSKTFLDNIKLAQTYTFEKGINGLSEMAKRSVQIRQDMSQVASFADKVSTLEGSLNTAASLSVLGGNFATFSNPMQMLYEGLNDMEGLSKRMEDMFAGFVYYDRDKKQLEMDAFNRQRMKAATQAMGIDYNSAMDQAFAQGRRKYLEPTVNSMGFDEETKNAILNQAYIDENGQGKVNIDNKAYSFSDIKESPELMKKVMQGDMTDSQNLVDIAINTRGMAEMMEDLTKMTDENQAYFVEQLGVGKASKKLADLAIKQSDKLAALNMVGIGIHGVLSSIEMIVGMIYATHGLGMMGGARFGGAGGAAGGAGGAAGSGGIFSKGSGFASKVWGNKGASWLGRQNTFGKTLGIATIGAGLGFAGGKIKESGMSDIAQGSRSTGKAKWGGALEGAGYGAAIGATVGSIIPGVGNVVGAGIGALIGGGIGLVNGHSDSMKAVLRNDIQKKTGVTLQGDYSIDELRKIKRGTSSIDSSLQAKILDNEGLTQSQLSVFDGVRGYRYGGLFASAKKMADGGILHGSGNGTSDSNLAALSNGEYIMPADKTSNPNNLKILESMRKGDSLIPKFSNGGINISPSSDNLKPVSVAHTEERRETKSSSSTEKISGSVKLEPLNISGSIRLDMNGSTGSIDARDLLNNTQFIKNITDLIAKNLNKQAHYGYDKNEFYKKF